MYMGYTAISQIYTIAWIASNFFEPQCRPPRFKTVASNSRFV